MRDILYIFDMGGVVSLHTDVFPDVCRHLGITEKEFCLLAEDNLEKLLNGEISTDEFWDRFSGRYGKRVAEELFGKFFHPRLNQGTVDLIKTLKQHSRVVSGTNTFDPHYNCHLSLGDYDIFHAVYASNKIGLSKPNPNFFRHILNNEGTEPENAFFVDDTEKHVIAAKNMGLRSILFKDAESLKSAVDRLLKPLPEAI